MNILHSNSTTKPTTDDQETLLTTAWRQIEGTCLVSVSGRITIDSSADLRTLLLQHLQAMDAESLTLDIFGVDYIDTSALAVLLEVLRSARTLKKKIRLTGLRDGPRFLLETMRLLPLFDEGTGAAFIE